MAAQSNELTKNQMDALTQIAQAQNQSNTRHGFQVLGNPGNPWTTTAITGVNINYPFAVTYPLGTYPMGSATTVSEEPRVENTAFIKSALRASMTHDCWDVFGSCMLIGILCAGIMSVAFSVATAILPNELKPVAAGTYLAAVPIVITATIGIFIRRRMNSWIDRHLTVRTEAKEQA